MARQRDVYFAIILGAALVFVAMSGGFLGAVTGDDGPSDGVSHNCGDDASCDITVTWQNDLNDTGQETRDVTAVVKGNGISTEISDTTDNTLSLQAGVEDVEISVKGSDTVNAYLHRASGDATAENGVVTFDTDSNKDIIIYGEDHATLEARSYNNVDANFFNDTSTDGADPVDYQTDPITFTSNDDSKIAVGSGGELDARIDVRTQEDDAEFADYGLVIGVVADTTKWDSPTVQFEGQSLADQSASAILGANGAQAIGSTYDYLYEVDRGAFNELENPDNYRREIEFAISALSGTDPADGDDVEVDLLSKSTYEPPTADNELEVDTHDAGLNAIQSIFDITYDVT